MRAGAREQAIWLAVELRRRSPEMPPEHRGERALAGIATIESDIDDPLAVRQPAEREEKPRLFTPLRKGHAGLLDEQAVHRRGARFASIRKIARHRIWQFAPPTPSG